MKHRKKIKRKRKVKVKVRRKNINPKVTQNLRKANLPKRIRNIESEMYMKKSQKKMESQKKKESQKTKES